MDTNPIGMHQLQPSNPHHPLHPPHNCVLHLLLLSQPPIPLNISKTSASFQPQQGIPFSPWKPGDAFSVEDDINDWGVLMGPFVDGEQIR